MDATDRELLELAGTFYRDYRHRDQAALNRFGMSSTVFWARVNRLIDEPAAAVELPQVVARLRRLRSSRQRLRRAS